MSKKPISALAAIRQAQVKALMEPNEPIYTLRVIRHDGITVDVLKNVTDEEIVEEHVKLLDVVAIYEQDIAKIQIIDIDDNMVLSEHYGKYTKEYIKSVLAHRGLFTSGESPRGREMSGVPQFGKD